MNLIFFQNYFLKYVNCLFIIIVFLTIAFIDLHQLKISNILYNFPS